MRKAYLRIELLLHVDTIGSREEVIQEDKDIADQVKGEIITGKRNGIPN